MILKAISITEINTIRDRRWLTVVLNIIHNNDVKSDKLGIITTFPYFFHTQTKKKVYKFFFMKFNRESVHVKCMQFIRKCNFILSCKISTCSKNYISLR